MCGLAASGQLFSEKKEIIQCEMGPDTRVEEIRLERAPRHSPRFKPIINIPTNPTNTPQVKPNVRRKIKYSEPTPKLDETSYPNT